MMLKNDGHGNYHIENDFEGAIEEMEQTLGNSMRKSAKDSLWSLGIILWAIIKLVFKLIYILIMGIVKFFDNKKVSNDVQSKSNYRAPNQDNTNTNDFTKFMN